MLGKLSNSDGLLLLFEAAKHLEEPRKTQSLNTTLTNSRSISQSSTHKKINLKFPPRSTHNELEKSRRAHLRTCMESLKIHLNFDSDATRITMLSILKKASKTIQELKVENKSLQEAETKQKARWNQLMKKKSHLKKRIENRRYNKKIQNWRERNRNYSECSINTTSSEDSEFDFQSRGISRSRLVIQSMPPQNGLSPRANSLVGGVEIKSPNSAKGITSGSSSTATTPPTQMTGGIFDTFDGCSLDSGYEENSQSTPNSNSLCGNEPSAPLASMRFSSTTSNVNLANKAKLRVDIKNSEPISNPIATATGLKRNSSNFLSISGPIKKINSTFIRTDIPIENCSV